MGLDAALENLMHYELARAVSAERQREIQLRTNRRRGGSATERVILGRRPLLGHRSPESDCHPTECAA